MTRATVEQALARQPSFDRPASLAYAADALGHENLRAVK